MDDPLVCRHAHRRVIAKDLDSEYLECVDCGEILEADELPEPSGFSETLSDA